MTTERGPAPKCPDCGIVLFFGPSHNCNPRTSHQQPGAKKVAEPKPKSLPTTKRQKRSAEIGGMAAMAYRPERTPEERDQILGELRKKTKRLTPHPDCEVCNARRERTKASMRKRRSNAS